MNETTTENFREKYYPREGFDPIKVRIEGDAPAECLEALDQAMRLLDKALGENLYKLCAGLEISIVDDLATGGGGHAIAEENRIEMDKTKSAMSINEARKYLTSQGIIEEGEEIGNLIGESDEPWSEMVPGLIHEVGHIIDWRAPGNKYQRLDPVDSPTKYGQTKGPHEAFAEAFTYWVYDLPQSTEVTHIVEETVRQNKGK